MDRAAVRVLDRVARHLPDLHECIKQRGHDERLLALPRSVLHHRLELGAPHALRPEQRLLHPAILLFAAEFLA